MSNKLRAFIAVPISDSIKNELKIVQDKLSKSEKSLKLVNVLNMHITIAFLGQITPEQTENINSIINHITCSMEPFKIDISGLGYFGKRSCPNIIFADLKNYKALSAIYLSLKNKLKQIDLELEDREFTPHLTLARNKNNQKINISKIIENLKNHKFGKQKVSRIELIKSTLTPTGSIYNTLYTSKFKEIKNPWN